MSIENGGRVGASLRKDLGIREPRERATIVSVAGVSVRRRDRAGASWRTTNLTLHIEQGKTITRHDFEGGGPSVLSSVADAMQAAVDFLNRLDRKIEKEEHS